MLFLASRYKTINFKYGLNIISAFKKYLYKLFKGTYYEYNDYIIPIGGIKL